MYLVHARKYRSIEFIKVNSKYACYSVTANERTKLNENLNFIDWIICNAKRPTNLHIPSNAVYSASAYIRQN